MKNQHGHWMSFVEKQEQNSHTHATRTSPLYNHPHPTELQSTRYKTGILQSIRWMGVSPGTYFFARVKNTRETALLLLWLSVWSGWCCSVRAVCTSYWYHMYVRILWGVPVRYSVTTETEYVTMWYVTPAGLDKPIDAAAKQLRFSRYSVRITAVIRHDTYIQQ